MTFIEKSVELSKLRETIDSMYAILCSHYYKVISAVVFPQVFDKVIDEEILRLERLNSTLIFSPGNVKGYSLGYLQKTVSNRKYILTSPHKTVDVPYDTALTVFDTCIVMRNVIWKQIQILLLYETGFEKIKDFKSTFSNLKLPVVDENTVCIFRHQT